MPRYRVDEILELELVRVRSLDREHLGLSVAAELDRRLEPVPGVVHDDVATLPDHLELLTDRDVQAGVELGDDTPRRVHRRREADVDSSLVEDVRSVHLMRLAGEQSCRVDAVAADVHQRATVRLGEEAGIGGIVGREAECGADQPELPDGAVVHELREPERLRMMAPHETFHQVQPLALRDVECALRLRLVGCQRLLAQDVLARLERPDRPLDVLPVGQRDVDGLDVGVLEEPVVAAVGALDPVLSA